MHPYVVSMVLTGNSMDIAVKFGINTTLVVLEMVNFTRLCLMKFIPISNTTLVVFVPNFTIPILLLVLIISEYIWYMCVLLILQRTCSILSKIKHITFGHSTEE